MRAFLIFLCYFVTILFPEATLFGQGLSVSTTPSIFQNSISLCLDDRGNISYSASYSLPHDSIIWNFQGGSPSSAIGTGTHVVAYGSTGSFTTTVTVYNGGGVDTSAVLNVEVRQIGSVAFSPSQTTFCNNDPAFTLDGNSPPGGYFTGPGVSGGTFHPDQSGSGNKTIWYVVKDGACADSASATINVKTAPITTLSSLGSPTPFQGKTVYSICPPTMPTFGFTTSTPASEYVSFQLDFGDGSVPLTGSTFPAVASHTYPAGLYKAVLTLTAANGCSEEAEVYVFYGSNPAVGFNLAGNTEACLESDTSSVEYFFPITNTAGNPPGTVYEVQFNDGSPSQFFQHPPPDSVSHRFRSGSCGTNSTSYNNAFQAKIIASNPCASSAATVEPILISEPAKAGFAVPARACLNSSVSVHDTSYSGQYVQASTSTCDTTAKVVWSISPSTYVLNSGDEGMRVDPSNPTLWFAGSSDLDITFLDTGTYVIKQVVGSTQACAIDSVEHIICVDTAPAGSIALDKNTICVGDSITAVFGGDVFQGCDGLAIDWSVPDPAHGFLGSTAAHNTAQNYIFHQPGVWPIIATVSNQCGSITLQDSVVVRAKPEVSLPLDSTVCGLYIFDFADTVLRPTVIENLDSAALQWSVTPSTGWSFIGGTGSSSSYPQIDFTAYGTYQIILEATNSCGSDADTMWIILNEPPQIGTLSDTVLCPGEDVSYNAQVSAGTPPFSYRWYAADTLHNTTASIGLSSLQANVELAFVVEDAMGCTDSSLVNVEVMPIPSVNAGADQMVCYHDSTQLQATVIGGKGPFSYSWSPVAGLSDPTVPDPWRSPLDSNVIYVLTLTDSLGCTYTDTMEVQVYPIPFYDAGDDFTICINSGDTILDGTVPVNGFWTGAGITGSTFDPVAAGLGVHHLVYEIIDNHGCHHFDTVEVTVISQPVADFGMDQSEGCSPLTINFSDSTVGGGTYEWYKNGVLFSTAANPSATFFNAGAVTDRTVEITLVFRASSGCSDSLTKQVTVFPEPTADFALPPAICAGDSISLLNNSVVKTGNVTYQWSASGADLIFSDTTVAVPVIYAPDFQNGADSLSSIQLIVFSPDGCSDTLSQNLLIHSRPVADFGLPAEVCGSSVLFPSDSSTGDNLSYQWSIAPQTGVSVFGASTATPQFDIDSPPQDPQVYQVTVTATDGNGCTDQITKDYTVYPLPAAAFTALPQDSCGPLSVNFFNVSDPHITGEDVGDMTFEWDFGNGQTSQMPHPTMSYYNTGVQDSLYPVRLVAINSYGCADTLYDTIAVHPDPKAELTLGNTVSCAPFYIDSTTVGAVMHPGANAAYSWKVYDADTLLLYEFSGSGALRDTIHQDGDSLYVRLVVTSLFDCGTDSSDLQLLYTIENPVPNFAALPDTICSGGTVSLRDSSSPGVNHEWYVNNIFVSAAQNPDLQLFNNSHTTDSVVSVKLRITAGSGCADSITRDVVVLPAPLAQFSASTVCAGDSLQILNSSLGNSLSFRWSSNDTVVLFADTTAADPVLSFPDNQSGAAQSYQVQLIATNSDGCSDTATENITVHTRPVASFSVPAAACGPLSVSPTDQSSGTVLSYQWEISPQTGVTVAGAATAVPQFDIAAPLLDSLVYRIKLTVTDTNGCSDTLSQNYTVYPLPTAGFTPNQSDSCGPLTVNFTNTSSPNITGESTSNMSFEWDFGNGNHSQVQDPSFTFTNSGIQDSVYPIRLVAFNGFGCADTLYDSITVHPDPRAEVLVGSTASCAPFQIDSTVVEAVRYNWANAHYIWKIYDPDTILIGSYTGAAGIDEVMMRDNDSIYVRLVVTSPFGCATDSTDLYIFRTIENPKPAFIAVPDSICSGGTVVFQDSSSAGVSHEWFVNDSLFSTAASPSLMLRNSSHTTDSVVSIKLRITAGSGCSDSISKNVVVHPRPLAQFDLAAACAGDIVQSSSTSIAGSALDYYWSSSDTAVVFSDSSAANPLIYFPDNQSGTDQTYQVQLIVANAEGCADTAMKGITVYSRPIASFTLPAAACGPISLQPIDQSVGSGFSYQWGISPQTGVVVSGGTTSAPQFDIAAPAQDSMVYQVMLLVTDINGCTDTLSQSYTVYPLPKAGFTASAIDSCGPLTVDFTNASDPKVTGQMLTNMSFDWDFGNGQNSQAENPQITFTNTGVVDSIYPVRLVAYNSFGCADTLYDSIVVRPDPHAELDTGKTVSCAPFVIDHNNISAVLHPNANQSYEWQVMDLSSGSVVHSFNGPNSVNFSMSQPGDSVLVRLVTTGIHGCANDTAEQLFTTIQNPAPGFVLSDSAGCHPLNLSITDTSSPGLTYQWYINGQLQTSTAANPAFTLTNTSTAADSLYTIKLVVTASTGCKDSTSQDAIVHALPATSFSYAEVCNGDSIFFQNQTTSIDSVVQWDWDFGDGNSSSEESPAHFYAGYGQYVAVLTATDSRGCVQSFLDTVRVRPNPQADFTSGMFCAPDTACLNKPFAFSDISSVLPLGGNIVIHEWDMMNDGVIDHTSANPTHIFNQAGIFDVKLEVETQYGCRDSIVRQVVVLDTLRAFFTTDTSAVCGPLDVNVADSSQGLISNYEWELVSLNRFGAETTIFSSTQQASGSIPTLVPGYERDTVYIIRLTVSNCCDTSSFERTFRLRPLPVAGMSVLPTSGCSGFKSTFVLDGHTFGKPDSLILDFGDGSTRTLQPNKVIYFGDTIHLFGAQSHHYINNGNEDTTYVASLTAINGCGDSTVSIPIVVHPNIVQASFAYTPQQGCEDLTVNFTDASYGGTSVGWYFDFDSINNTPQQFADTGLVVSHTYTEPGTYLVAQVVNDGCSFDTAFASVTVFDAPDPEFAYLNNLCEGDTFRFTNQTQVSMGSITFYRWSFGDGDSISQKDPVHAYDSAGVYDVWLVAGSSNGCMDSVMHRVAVYDRPNVDFGYQHACLNEQPIIFTDSTTVQTGSIVQTVWDFGDGNTSAQLHPRHSYSAPGAYRVTLYKQSSNGCIDSASHTVNIFPIPEADFGYRRTSGDSCGAPQHLQFSNRSSGADGYYWDFNFNNAPGQDTSRLNNPRFTYTDPGVYEVLLVTHNGYNCHDSIIKTVMVRPFPKAGFMADTLEGCAPFTVTFTDTTRYDFNGPGGIEEWYWDFGDGSTQSGSPVVSHRYETDGVYDVSLTVVTNGGCVDSVTYQQYIVAHPTPGVMFNSSSLDARTFFFGNSTETDDLNVQWIWTFGDGEMSYEKSPEHRYDVDLFEKDYTFTVCLTATNSIGCDSVMCQEVDLTGYQLSVPNAFAPEQRNAGEGSIFLPKGHALMEYHLKVFDKWGNTVFESFSLNEEGIPDEHWDGTVNGRKLPMGSYVWKIIATFNDGTTWPGKMYKDKIRRNHGTVTLIR